MAKAAHPFIEKEIVFAQQPKEGDQSLGRKWEVTWQGHEQKSG